MTAMWKPNQTGTPSIMPPQTQMNPSPVMPVGEPVARAVANSVDQTTISKGIVFMGEIKGTEALYIDGKVEGSINLPGNRVTVGRNGQVAASISSRELVILGKVRGNVSASDRVDIRAEGALTGDITAARISIEDGAFFKGGIDIRKPANGASPAGASQPAQTSAESIKTLN